ncbi:MAG: hypothetical protein K8Q91_01790 [Candidatus Vogelbacteria bacterium]|nr:hypothetical protein [Candidatus Vogelbacteria bacterium]
MKFNNEMITLQKELESAGHTVYMPIAIENLDYWQEDGAKRVEAKKGQNLVATHMDKIEKSEAILVANYTKGDSKNYIGANTFLEMGFAHYRGKKIFALNTLPDQKYISDELLSFDPIILNGDISNIS